MSHPGQGPCDAGVAGHARDGDAVAGCSAATGRWVLAATILASSMSFIDGTVVNVALPTLQKSLGASVADLQWVVESYALTLSAFLLLGGVLGDRYGRNRVMAVGVALFAAASLWCGFAPDAGQLIAARAVQGLGAALLVPNSLAIINANFGKGDRGRAIGTWSAFSALTTAAGPVLGGWLIDAASWRWIFFINLPPAALILWMLWARVPETRDPKPPSRVDWLGAALASAGLGGLVFGLIEAGQKGLGDPLVWAPVAAGLLALGAFLVVEARLREPMMPLAVFRSATFSGANLITLCLYAALGAAFFLLPFNFGQIQAMSATEIGLALLPFVVLMVVLSRWAGGLVDRLGGRLPLAAGSAIAALGYALLLIPDAGASYWLGFLPGLMVLGLGMAVAVAPLTTVVMAAVDDSRGGIASGINNTVARMAGLLAVAAIGLLAVRLFQGAAAAAAADLPDVVRQALAGHDLQLTSISLPDGLGAEAARQARAAVEAAFVYSFRWSMAACAALAALASLTAWLMVRKEPDPSA